MNYHTCYIHACEPSVSELAQQALCPASLHAFCCAVCTLFTDRNVYTRVMHDKNIVDQYISHFVQRGVYEIKSPWTRT